MCEIINERNALQRKIKRIGQRQSNSECGNKTGKLQISLRIQCAPVRAELCIGCAAVEGQLEGRIIYCNSSRQNFGEACCLRTMHVKRNCDLESFAGQRNISGDMKLVKRVVG